MDISPEMIARAREALARSRQRRCSRSPTDRLTCGDASLDFVTSFIVFQHVPSRAAVYRYLREAARVLKGGGVLRFQVGRAAPGARQGRGHVARASGSRRTRFARGSSRMGFDRRGPLGRGHPVPLDHGPPALRARPRRKAEPFPFGPAPGSGRRWSASLRISASTRRKRRLPSSRAGRSCAPSRRPSSRSHREAAAWKTLRGGPTTSFWDGPPTREGCPSIRAKSPEESRRATSWTACSLPERPTTDSAGTRLEGLAHVFLKFLAAVSEANACGPVCGPGSSSPGRL